MNKELSYQIIAEHICACGEGPVWDDANKRLYWIDIVNGQINCLNQHQQLKKIETGQKIGAIALTESGDIIAALKNGLYRVDISTGLMTKIIDPEYDKPDNRFNDGKCDPVGRFWAGTMSDIGEIAKGSLYTLEPDGTISEKLTGLSISNGLAWDLNEKKFYHIDTPTRQIVAFDYCNEMGEITNGKPIIMIDKTEGVPDGMTIDEEGMLWVAHWNGGRVSRWNPKTATKQQEVFLPVSKVTSCTFGGDNLGDLYITTARIGLTEKELAEQPHAGATFLFKNIGVKGVANTPVKDKLFLS